MQGELFPQFQGSTLDDFPEDLRADLETITGGFKMDERLGLPTPEATRGIQKTAQEKFLEDRAKKTEKTKIEITEPKLLVIDLATPEGQQQYQDVISTIMPMVLSDQKTWKFNETAFPMMIDPAAPAGFRLIVTIRYWQQKEVVVPGDHGFVIANREKTSDSD
jgi:hypothetical protein